MINTIMLKKNFFISALMLFTLSMIFTSCFKNEEDDIFDKSAADRLEESVKTYSDILCAQGGKWAMEYVANEDEPGYVYLMDFKSDGSVTITGDNKWIAKLTNPSSNDPEYASEISMWQVITDNGPVLSFNTYNRIFHLFADPEDVPDNTQDDPDETGYGHSGDYEFDIMKYQNDTLFLEGKKYELPILMYRVDASVSNEDYFAHIRDMINSTKSARFPDLLLTGSNGRNYIVNNINSMVVSFYPELGDPVIETVTANAIATREGFRFINPLTLLDSAATQQLTIQHFALQEDGSFLCTDDGVSRITSFPLGTVFAGRSYNWRIDKNALGGVFATAYQAVVDGVKQQFKKNFTYFDFHYDAKTSNSYVFYFNSANTIGSFYMKQANFNGNQCKFEFTGECDNNASVYSQRVPAFTDFVSLLSSTSFNVEATSVFNPVRLIFTSTTNAEDYFTVDLK